MPGSLHTVGMFGFSFAPLRWTKPSSYYLGRLGQHQVSAGSVHQVFAVSQKPFNPVAVSQVDRSGLNVTLHHVRAAEV